MEAFLDRLRLLCSIDTPTGHLAGLDACAHVLAELALAAGCGVELVPSADGLHLIATTRGRGQGRIVLIGHHDTVFPVGTAAARPLRRSGARFLGPGVADMKGGVLVALAALERLAAEPDGQHGTVELHCVPDEEGRNDAPIVLDRLRGATAALCFECGRMSGAIVSARKAGTWLTLTAHGRPAHAGTEPELGRSALVALAAETLRITREIDGGRPGVTANVTTFRAGDSKNTIAAHAQAVVDLRARSGDDLGWAVGRLDERPPLDGVTIDRTDDRGFPPLTRDAALVELTLRTLADLGETAAEEAAGGVSDGSWTSNVGVPTVDGLGPIGGLDHTPDEYIELGSVPGRIEATVRLCRALGRPAAAVAAG